jgi:putative nucleotidyltransferase with HDIG domain
MSVALAALAVDAQEMAYSLVGGMGNRWRHTVGVAQRAAELAGPLGLDHDTLVAAAWLHDIGYAEPTKLTGFHPLDGADYLAAWDWPGRIPALVANHSGARFIAVARGLGSRLAAYPDLEDLLADALTYADQTVGPCGDRVGPGDRYAEMLHRHGPESWNAKVDHLRRPHLQAITGRVEAHLRVA